jgi:hypothetical protein
VYAVDAYLKGKERSNRTAPSRESDHAVPPVKSRKSPGFREVLKDIAALVLRFGAAIALAFGLGLVFGLLGLNSTEAVIPFDSPAVVPSV